ncbi:hypothetical protein BDW42DRAFT_191018 [Aspergillus taichungensis]|uniref:P-loop containing nucleoside triphosphate hydrolase protein n=1 Tax=Aspergillus taichungensis TaxID=482145 RepID=A0A2J5I5F8_9EURO|nr:hypothetical protein BDW42DRAFT_191018 [Aspergillus taichungensis]
MANIIGISGPSSSGKTTLARLLQRIFNGVLDDTTTTSSSSDPKPKHGETLRTFIIHEDDFYKPDDRIPYTTTKTGQTIQDWDTAAAIDIPLFTASLAYVRAHGSLPPRLTSIQDQNEVRESGVSGDVICKLREGVRGRLLSRSFSGPSSEQRQQQKGGQKTERVVVFLEGFLLYAAPGCPAPMRDVHSQIDVGLFLPAPYDRVKERRESRTGYATIGAQPDVDPAVAEGGGQSGGGGEGKVHEDGEKELREGEAYEPPQNFWTDPPGYVDDVVWPRYVRDHTWLLLPEGGEGRFTGEEDDEELVRRVGQGVDVRSDAGVVVAPGRGEKSMVEVLEWAVEEVMNYLLSGGVN